jgi:hypothetical protein
MVYLEVLSRRRSECHVHHIQVLVLGFSWKQRITSIQLSSNTPEAPDVYTAAIGHAKHNLRSPVESALNVCIYLFILKAARAEVDEPDA